VRERRIALLLPREEIRAQQRCRLKSRQPSRRAFADADVQCMQFDAVHAV
jgi:hypothetical protein